MTEKTIVKPMDPALKNSAIGDPNENESTVILDGTADRCVWNGQIFAEGARVECDGAEFECSFGRWFKN